MCLIIQASSASYIKHEHPDTAVSSIPFSEIIVKRPIIDPPRVLKDSMQSQYTSEKQRRAHDSRSGIGAERGLNILSVACSLRISHLSRTEREPQILSNRLSSGIRHREGRQNYDDPSNDLCCMPCEQIGTGKSGATRLSRITSSHRAIRSAGQSRATYCPRVP